MKRRIFLKFLIIFLPTLLFGLAVFLVGIEVGKREPICGVINREIGKPEEVDFSLFWDVWRVLQEKYVEKSKLDPEKMMYGAISGLVQSLEDPYTVFFTPEESKEFLEDLSGKFEGVGIEIAIRNDVLTVIAPLEGTPAKKAGIKAGDKIIAIDGKPTAGITIDKAVKLIRGPKGTEIKLTIQREGWPEPKEFTIIREIIEIPSFRLEFKEGIAYLRIYQFFSKTSADFREVADEILKKKPRGIIIDVRDNPGGYLEVAQEIASWFIPKGEIVVIEDFGNGRRQEYRAKGRNLLGDYPVVVLINQGSASASEILAGALRDHLGAKLIGEKTFGKGSIQVLNSFINGSAVKVTVARWLTPNGTLINGKGLEPDIKVEITEEDYAQDRDPQLEKAFEIIRSLK